MLVPVLTTSCHVSEKWKSGESPEQNQSPRDEEHRCASSPLRYRLRRAFPESMMRPRSTNRFLSGDHTESEGAIRMPRPTNGKSQVPILELLWVGVNGSSGPAGAIASWDRDPKELSLRIVF